MRSKQKTLVWILLIPLIFVVLFQGILTFATLMATGIKDAIEQNRIEIVNNIVENRGVVLENRMVDEWSAIGNEGDTINFITQRFLTAHDCTIDELLADKDLQQLLLAEIAPELTETLRRDNTHGCFIILANDQPIDTAGQYTGFFLRDSDPDKRTTTNSDLLVERGHKSIARNIDVTLDSTWCPVYRFGGKGNRSCDDFFYQPLAAALEHPDTEMKALGYWSRPFVLEDVETDNHHMITYSIPLILNGKVYGVLGSEVSVASIRNTCFSVRELDDLETAGYILAIKNSDGTYSPLVGTGSLYDAVCGNDATFALSESDLSDMYIATDAKIGSARIFATISNLKIYSNITPYPDTEWVVCALVSEDSIFELGNRMYKSILAMVILSAAVGVLIMTITVRRITKPVHGLVESVRGGIAGIRAFKPVDILEVDELHKVIRSLTEESLLTNERLEEEKERYKIAIESSSDIYFTYYPEENQLALVNSHGYDGLWDLNSANAVALSNLLRSGESRDQLITFMEDRGTQNELRMQLCFGQPGEYRWYMIRKRSIDSASRFVIGFIRDIHEEMLEEMEIMDRRSKDLLTGLYCLVPGIEAIDQSRKLHSEGTMITIDITGFNEIVAANGINFGDLLLNEFAGLLTAFADDLPGDSVTIRAGSDEFVVWTECTDIELCTSLLEQLHEKYRDLLPHSTRALSFSTGIVRMVAGDSTQLCIKRSSSALIEARKQDTSLIVWNEHMPCNEVFEFGEIVSQGFSRQMSFVSFTLHLFDKSEYLEEALDLLTYSMNREYALQNLVITAFQSDFGSSTLEYIRNRVDGLEEKRTIIRHSHKELERLTSQADRNTLTRITEENDFPICGKLRSDCLIYPMSNYRSYSGSIVFAVSDPEVYSKHEKELREIAAIIQNRINQEHRDRSAQAKADFLANMSHEIRTPMNGIIGMTEIALREGQTDERRLDCLRKVRSSSDFLLGLINDILDMSKIESGKMRFVCAPFNLFEMIEELHSTLDVRFEEKQQSFTIDRAMTNHSFVGDRLRINQVLLNLLGNATKYSDNGTDVSLTVREYPIDDKESDLYFAVTDHGIGVSDVDKLRIFQSFERVENASIHQQGTGLGLAISNRLVQIMGGTIDLESCPGEGSTFSFTIRLPIAPDTQPTETNEVHEIDLTGKRILAVEDNELNMEIITALLSDFGAEMEGVENGKLAVDRFNENPAGYYDMIIMDIMMPVMNGLDAANAIRNSDHADAKTIPIIAMSANAFEEDVKRSLASGMNAHLSKPIDLQKLLSTLNSFITK